MLLFAFPRALYNSHAGTSYLGSYGKQHYSVTNSEQHLYQHSTKTAYFWSQHFCVYCSCAEALYVILLKLTAWLKQTTEPESIHTT